MVEHPQPSTSKLFVNAVLNGRAKKFLLDTGAYRTSVEVDEDNHFLPVLSVSESKGVSGGRTSCDLVRFDDFQVAGGPSGKLTLERCPPHTQVHNLLGIDSLSGRVVEMNFDESRLQVLEAAPANVPMSPMQRSIWGHLVLPIQIGDRKGVATFDTGAEYTVVNQDLVSERSDLFRPVVVTVDGRDRNVSAPAVDASGQVVGGTLYVIDHLKVGTMDFGRQFVVAMAFLPEMKKRLSRSMLLGANTIVGANWIFDLKRNRFGASVSRQGAAAVGGP
jgi:hypothetical protein